jgi:uncharacterized membrane protein YfcA
MNQIIILSLTALLIGLAKTGLTGINLIALPLMASIYGGKASSGIVLVLLIVGDLFGVFYYHAHADKKSLVGLIPWAVVGVILGTLVGERISNEVFLLLMAIIILISISIILIQEIRKQPITITWSVASGVLGILGGFTTMIGNVAGAVMTLYLLSKGMTKNSMIGTGAWFFFLINLFKVPFHVMSWGTINLDTLVLVAPFTPLIVLGALVGVRLVAKIPEAPYRYVIIALTIVAAGYMLLT